MAAKPNSSSIQLFNQLFGNFPAHTAMLDLSGRIVAVNHSWTRFGQENGLADNYEFEGCDYIQVCENAAGQSRYAVEAMVGLLEVMKAGRPTFSMVYPCHSPTEQRWFRLWVESQWPQSPAVIVAHTRLRDYFDFNDTDSSPVIQSSEVPPAFLNQPTIMIKFR